MDLRSLNLPSIIGAEVCCKLFSRLMSRNVVRNGHYFGHRSMSDIRKERKLRFQFEFQKPRLWILHFLLEFLESVMRVCLEWAGSVLADVNLYRAVGTFRDVFCRNNCIHCRDNTVPPESPPRYSRAFRPSFNNTKSPHYRCSKSHPPDNTNCSHSKTYGQDNMIPCRQCSGNTPTRPLDRVRDQYSRWHSLHRHCRNPVGHSIS